MFQLDTQVVEGHPLLHLHDNAGVEAVFAPTLGARVLRLSLRHAPDARPSTVLDTGLSGSDLANLRSQSAILAPWPNRIAGGQYSWQGTSYQLPITEAPRGNAIHGLVAAAPWVRVSDPTGGIEDGVIAFEHAYAGSQGYPFSFRLRVLYHLQPDHLAVTWLVRNEHHASMPFGLGWHPYFQLGDAADKLELRIPATTLFDVDDKRIPTGEQPYVGPFRLLHNIGDSKLDDCFRVAADGDTGGDGVANTLLINPITGRSLVLVQPAGAFPFIQIFTPEHRKTVALEPMTCPPDVYNQPIGLIELAPGDTWRASVRVELH